MQWFHSPLSPRTGPRRTPSAAWGLLAVLWFVPFVAPSPARADLDVVFALDTTGSMGGELEEVQQRVRQLAASLAESRPGERLRFGIVAYRDRGDEYVTRTFALTSDVEAANDFLGALEAGGGGDGPESVVAALAAALREQPWDLSDAVDRQLFLIGDAPPHLDYGDDPDPRDLAAEARRDRIAIHAIGCRSLSRSGIDFFRSMAYATEGTYQHIGRVRAAEAGALTRALDATARRSAARPADRGRAVRTSWRLHDGSPTEAIAARLGRGGVLQDPGGGPSCVLELLLPPGTALEGDPRVRLAADGLHVGLGLGPGDGGRDVFDLALDPCPPLGTPVHLDLGDR